jgi:hypothetical protein
MDDATAISAPLCSQYDPFRGITYNPGRQYCADRAVWDTYKAALFFNELQERKRCQKIVQAYADMAPEHVRPALLNLIQQIEFPILARESS